MGVQIGLAPWERAWQTLKPSICAPWSIFTLLGGTPRDTAMSYKSIHRGIAHKQHENPKFCQGWVGDPVTATQETCIWWGVREARLRSRHSMNSKEMPATPLHQKTGGGTLLLHYHIRRQGVVPWGLSVG